jgi:hypothetical protein
METIRPTPVDELRKPHPQQRLIDAFSAALLRATASPARLGQPTQSPQAPVIEPRGRGGPDTRP